MRYKSCRSQSGTLRFLLAVLILFHSISSPLAADAAGLQELELKPDTEFERESSYSYSSEFFEDFSHSLTGSTAPKSILDITCTPVQEHVAGNALFETIEVDLTDQNPLFRNPDKASAHCVSVMETKATSSPPNFSKKPKQVLIDVTNTAKHPAKNFDAGFDSTIIVSPERASENSHAFDLVSAEPNEHWSSPATNAKFNQFIFTFSKPVVSSEEVKRHQASKIPVIVKPAVKGRYFWFDPQTFIIKPTGTYLPSATLFDVSIPANLRSHAGDPILKSHHFQYQSPKPEGGLGTISPQRAFSVMFDQKVKPASVLAALKATSAGKDLPVRLATDQEMHAIFSNSTLEKNKWFAVFPSGYSLDQPIDIVLKPGVESEEGPVKSALTQKLTISFKPKLDSLQQPEHTYEPGEPIEIDFSGPINSKTVDPSLITIKPTVPNFACSYRNNSLILCGDTKANTNYTVHVPLDTQTDNALSTQPQREFKIKVGSYLPRLFPPRKRFLKIPTNQHTYEVCSINVNKIRVMAFSKEPSNRSYFISDSSTWKEKPFFETVIEPAKNLDVPVKTIVNLRELEAKNPHEFFLRVEDANIKEAKAFESNKQHPKYWHRSGMAYPRTCSEFVREIQRTNLNLTTSLTADKVICYVADWQTGRPVPGAEITGSQRDDAYRFTPVTSKVNFEAIANRQRTQVRGTTNSSGICEFYFSKEPTLDACNLFTARKDNDVVEVPMNCGKPPDEKADFTWYVDAENNECLRQQPVKFWGWVKPKNDRGLVNQPMDSYFIEYSLHDSQSQDIANGKIKLTANGAFHGQFNLPPSTSCGNGTIKYKLVKDGVPLSEQESGFIVAEEKEAIGDFDLGLDHQNIELGKPTRATVHKRDAAGKELPNQEVIWSVFTARTPYRPFGWSGFTFTPASMLEARQYNWNAEKQISTKTNERGETSLDININKSATPLPVTLIVSALERGPRGEAGRYRGAEGILHPPAYVGIKTSYKTEDGKKKISIESIVTDPEGRAVKDKTVRLRVSTLNREDNEADQTIWKKIIHSGSDTATAEAEIAELGPLVVSADLLHDENESVVLQSSSVICNSRNLWSKPKSGHVVRVSTDSDCYSAGDDCVVSIKAPFKTANGFALINTRDGIYSETAPVAISDGTGQTIIHLNGDKQTSDEPAAYSGLIKLYETHPSSSLSESAAETFAIKQRSAASPLSIKLENAEIAEAGQTISVNVTAHRADGSSASGAECVVKLVPVTSLGEKEYPKLIFRTGRDNKPTINCHSNDRFNPLNDSLSSSPKDFVNRTVLHPDAVGDICVLPNPGVLGAVCNQMTDSRMFFDRATEELKLDGRGSGSVTLSLPRHAGYYELECIAVNGTEFGAVSKTLRITEPVSVHCYVPTLVNHGDSYDLFIEIINRGTCEHNALLKLSSECCGLARDRNFTASPGITRIRLKSAHKTPDLKAIISIDRKNFSVDCAPQMVPSMSSETKRVQCAASGKVLLKETSDWRLASPLELTQSDDSTAIVVSAVSDMCNKQPMSSIDLAARALVLLELEKLCKQSSNPALLQFEQNCEPILREDICQLTKNYENLNQAICWLPKQRNARGLLFPFLMSAHAMLSANAEGISITEDKLHRLSSDLSMPSCGPDETQKDLLKKETAYLIFTNALIGRTVPDNSPGTQMLEQFVQRHQIERMSGEELSWLSISAQHLPIDISIKQRIAERFKNITEEGTEQLRASTKSIDGIVYSSAITNDATTALALTSSAQISERQKEYLAKLARDLENAGQSLHWNGPIESALAISALCEYELWKRKDLSSRKNTFATTLIPLSNDLEISSANKRSVLNVTYQRQAQVQTSPVDSGVAIKREFVPADNRSRVWMDDEGQWNCVLGSKIIEKISFVPQRRLDKVVLTNQISACFDSVESNMDNNRLFEGPTAFPSELVYWNEAGDEWAQEVQRNGSNFSAYANAVGPHLYETKYTMTAAATGRFFVPEAEIRTIFDDTAYGSTGSTFMRVHETDPR